MSLTTPDPSHELINEGSPGAFVRDSIDDMRDKLFGDSWKTVQRAWGGGLLKGIAVAAIAILAVGILATGVMGAGGAAGIAGGFEGGAALGAAQAVKFLISGPGALAVIAGGALGIVHDVKAKHAEVVADMAEIEARKLAQQREMEAKTRSLEAERQQASAQSATTEATEVNANRPAYLEKALQRNESSGSKVVDLDKERARRGQQAGRGAGG